MSREHRQFDAALHELLAHERRQGFDAGIAVAEKIRGWLTSQPDTDWQRQVRKWADSAIAKAIEQEGGR